MLHLIPLCGGTGGNEELGFVKVVKEKGSEFEKVDESKRESDVLSEEVNVGELKTNDGLGSSDRLKSIGRGLEGSSKHGLGGPI